MLVGRIVEYGVHLSFLGEAPLGRGELICLALLTWLESASRLAISWVRQPTCRLKPVSWLVGWRPLPIWLLVVKSCRLTGLSDDDIIVARGERYRTNITKRSISPVRYTTFWTLAASRWRREGGHGRTDSPALLGNTLGRVDEGRAKRRQGLGCLPGHDQLLRRHDPQGKR